MWETGGAGEITTDYDDRDLCLDCSKGVALQLLKQDYTTLKTWLESTHLKHLHELEKQIAVLEHGDEKTAAVTAFLEEVAAVCKKHGLSLSHEDQHGAFEVTVYREDNIEWLMSAHDERGHKDDCKSTRPR